MADQSPDKTSSDYDAMRPYWDLVDSILEGQDAMRGAVKGTMLTDASGNVQQRVYNNPYLPKFPNEAIEDYEHRRLTAPFTNIYRDIVETLSAKPFAKEVKLADGSSATMEEFVEDVDGAGNSMFVFGQQAFFKSINYAVDWIMVDHPRVPEGATLADERNMGARPYWVHVPATHVLAVYSARLGAREIFTHIRVYECVTARDGYGETEVERIRIYNREPIYGVPAMDGDEPPIIGYAAATFEILEKSDSDWVSKEFGVLSIGEIPMVPIVTGRRKGNSWRFHPPMQDAANLQVEHFQQESALKTCKELSAYIILAGQGVQPEIGEDGTPKPIGTGPRAVIYAPPSGDGGSPQWQLLEPSASSLTFHAAEVKRIEDQLRELGRQPLTAQTGNLTVIAAAFAGDKANSVIEAWTLNMKDALENALRLTSLWLGQGDEGPEVQFTADLAIRYSDEKDPDTLNAARSNGDLSQRTLWSEFKRRGILSPEFDPDEEEKRLEDEMPEESEQEILLAAELAAGAQEQDSGEEDDPEDQNAPGGANTQGDDEE